jgi:protein O-mannosyl-transferase
VRAPGASPRPGGPRRDRRWTVLGTRAARPLLVAAVLLAYAPSLRNGLVWDDQAHIVDNPRLSDVVTAVATYVGGPEGAYYRPLVFLSFATEHAVWAATPLGYHVTNLLLHALNTLLLLVLARRSGVSEHMALLGAAIFALHPIQTEAVAYVAGRTDLLMTTGALASCLLLLGAGAPLGRGIAAALAGAVALLSKESGYALVLLWPWLAWRHERTMRARLALAGPGAVIALALLAVRAGDLPDPALSLSPARLAGVGQAIASYAALLAWPIGLQVDRLTPLPAGPPALAVGLLALAAALALSAWGLTRRGAAGDWTAWTVAFYLPAANVVALYPAIADRALFTPEHNLYAPLAGLGVLAAMATARAASVLSPIGRRVAWASALSVLATWTALTAARCQAWRDERSLFGAAVAAGSSSPRVWYNYGNTLLQRGDVAEAVAAFTGAAARAPHDAAVWTNLGVAEQRQRKYAAAERAYRRAAELRPRDARIVENLGTLYLARGDLEAARAAFATALDLDPLRTTSRRALAAIAQAAPALSAERAPRNGAR